MSGIVKDLKTVGIVGHDAGKRLNDIVWPMGVSVVLILSTNPTSTVMANILHSVKTRDGIIIASHSSAVRYSYLVTSIYG